MRRLLAIAVLLLAAAGARGGDRLSDECIDLLAGDFADELDQDHSVCPDQNGKISFRAGGSREIDGIPDSELRDLVTDSELYDACRDLFAEAPLSTALRAIDSDPRRAMEKVFDAIRWEWHFFHPLPSDGFTIYACVDLTTLALEKKATVHLYRSMCAVDGIYVAKLGRLNLGTRFMTVASHEVGHVIDELSGCAGTFSDNAETRATVYGLTLAQCHARRWQALYELLADQIDPDAAAREAERQKILGCLRGKWEVMEHEIAVVRQNLVTGNAGGTGVPLQSISACAYAAGSGAAPRLSHCPTKED